MPIGVVLVVFLFNIDQICALFKLFIVDFEDLIETYSNLVKHLRWNFKRNELMPESR